MEEDIWVLEEAIRVSVERQVMEEAMRAKRENQVEAWWRYDEEEAAQMES